jgi:hypothetical protein
MDEINDVNALSLWTANDQCKLAYGPDASFCSKDYEHMCTILYCRRNITSGCVAYPGGAGILN